MIDIQFIISKRDSNNKKFLLPLIMGCQMVSSNLCKASLVADEIWLSNSSEGKTVVTLEVHLYSNFVIRMTELHNIFAVFKSYG